MAEKATSSEAESRPNSLQDELLGIPILRLPDAGDAPLYHVHQQDGVLICDNFLLGLCSRQEKCPNHHTPFPYHWQWRRKQDRVWLSFSFSVQHHLERLYCNKDYSLVPLHERSVFLDLDTLQLSGTGPQIYEKIRRLSNTRNPECNQYFPEEWKVYWMKAGAWKEYTEPIAQELVGAFERGMWNHAFYLHDRLYNVNIKQLTQCNVKTGFTRRITYRPVLRTCVTLAPHLRSLAPSLYSAAVPGEDPEDLYYGAYPAAWVPRPQEGSSFTVTEMTVSEVAYQKVWKHFHASLPENKVLVLAIYRIRNDKLWRAFIRQKKRMSRARSVEEQFFLEKHLFHGTGDQQIKPICTRNFDPRLAGLRHGAVWGRGSYFARDSELSHKYVKAAHNHICHMFLAKVLTGNWIEGKPALKRPSVSYDSCVNYPFNPKIFVVFRSSQCYPYFLIRYQEVNTQVNIGN